MCALLLPKWKMVKMKGLSDFFTLKQSHSVLCPPISWFVEKILCTRIKGNNNFLFYVYPFSLYTLGEDFTCLQILSGSWHPRNHKHCCGFLVIALFLVKAITYVFETVATNHCLSINFFTPQFMLFSHFFSNMNWELWMKAVISMKSLWCRHTIRQLLRAAEG